jgi:hypothetical protein
MIDLSLTQGSALGYTAERRRLNDEPELGTNALGRQPDAELTKHGNTHEFCSDPGAGQAFMDSTQENHRARGPKPLGRGGWNF